MTIAAPITKPDTTPVPLPTDGDHDRFAHIVLEGYWPSGTRDEGEFVTTGNCVVEGMVTGASVRAVCGTWIRPGRDPKKFPLCPTCREIAEVRGWKIPIQ